MQLRLDNEWMGLYSLLNGKVVEIRHIEQTTASNDRVDKLMATDGLVTVACDHEKSYFADQYGEEGRSTQLRGQPLAETSTFDGFGLPCLKHTFPLMCLFITGWNKPKPGVTDIIRVTAVCGTREEANAIMAEDIDQEGECNQGLIATIKKGREDLWYILCDMHKSNESIWDTTIT